MRYFEVLEVATKKRVAELVVLRDKDGNPIRRTDYRWVNAGEEGWYPGAYGHEKIKKGDILPIDGPLADKAAKNPAFKEVDDPKKAAPKEEEKPLFKKKRGRPRKVDTDVA